MKYRVSVRIEKDGREVGAGVREVDVLAYRDERRALEALAAPGFADASGEALNGAYNAAGIDQFPQGGNAENPETRE